MHRKIVARLVPAHRFCSPGCSSRPREFTPTLGIATADAAGFDQAYATCTQLMVAGKLDQPGRASSLGGGAAVGAGTMAVGAGAADRDGWLGRGRGGLGDGRFAPLRDHRRRRAWPR